MYYMLCLMKRIVASRWVGCRSAFTCPDIRLWNSLSSNILSVLLALFALQTLTPHADHPFVGGANTNLQHLCNLPYFGVWMDCQVCLHPFVIVRRCFIITLSCGFLRGVRLVFAHVRFLLALWR